MKKIPAFILICIFIELVLIYIAATNTRVSPAYLETGKPSPIFSHEEKALFSFIQKNFLQPDGGIITNLKPSQNSTETLSESIGILMQYCVLRDEKELFDRELSYLEKNMLYKGCFVKWRTGKPEVTCNAVVDDFRIIRALLDAYEKWGEKKYYDSAGFIQYALYEHLVKDGNLREFYDWNLDETAGRIPLCYIDLYTMDRLRIFNKAWQAVAEKGEATIKDGILDSPVTLFNKYYSYKDKLYSRDEEFASGGGTCLTYSLITMIHLLEYNSAPEPFLAWVDYEMSSDRLYAWYDPYTLSSVNDIESTAIYALASIYASGKGENSLSRILLEKMTECMVKDSGSDYYGGFGDTSTGEFYSFDNLMALLAFAMVR